MTRSLQRYAAACAFGFLATACATMPPAGPTHFYASYGGEHQPTQPLFEAVDTRMRAQPAFVRDFSEPMNVHIGDGVPAADGRLRHVVRITIPSRLANRRVSERNRVLATFDVTCVPDRPEPCVDEIIARARLQPARIRRILARSPKV